MNDLPKRRRLLAAVLVLFAFGGACSWPTGPTCEPGVEGCAEPPAKDREPTDPVPPEQVVTKYGMVSISTSVGTTSFPTAAVLATFYRSDPITVREIRSQAGAPDEPLCMVVALGEDPDPLPPGLLIDAGTPLHVHRSDGEPVFAIERSDGYGYDAVFDEALPDDVFLTIPGSHFPRFEGIAITKPDVLSFSNGTDTLSPVSDDTTLEWTPMRTTKGTSSFVMLTIQVGDDANGKAAVCGSPDSGSFAFPSATVAQLGGPGFQGTLLSYSRASLVERLDVASGAYLAVVTSAFRTPALP